MRVFIFDMGKVIVKGLRINQGMAEELGVDKGVFREDYWLYDRALMEGWMTSEDYYRHLELRFGRKVEGNIARRHFEPVPDDGLLSIADRLRGKGYRCVIGSNTFAPHWEKMLEEFPSVLSRFDKSYPSYLIHRAKPDASFFRYIQEEEGVPFSELCLIDDRKDNIVTAESLGMTAFQYSGEDLPSRAAAFFAPYLR